MGGQPGAAFIQLVHDMSVVVNDGDNLRVMPVIGGAAVQNIKDVLLLRGIDMALTTTETLAALKASGVYGNNLDEQIVYIAPLFPNALQILTRQEFKTIKDLQGKRVAFNNRGSATAEFVPAIFKKLGIQVEESFMPQSDAIQKIRDGQLDATLCGCPSPVPAYAAVKPEWGLHFVSVPYDAVLEGTYLPDQIRVQDYPGLLKPGAPVETIATKTVLISFNWQKDTIRYQKTAKFVEALFSKIEEFHKAPRHPLWKSVNIAASIPGWKRFPAAQEWLENWQRNLSKGTEGDFKRFLEERASRGATSTRTVDPDELFREFLVWTDKRRN